MDISIQTDFIVRVFFERDSTRLILEAIHMIRLNKQQNSPKGDRYKNLPSKNSINPLIQSNITIHYINDWQFQNNRQRIATIKTLPCKTKYTSTNTSTPPHKK